MDTMKKFWLYALLIVLFYIFSNVMINIAIKCSYSPVDTYLKQEQGIQIDINEAKATYANGYVGGIIRNENSKIEKTYLKIDLYSKRNTFLGTKYINIDNLELGETRDFRIGFRFTDVEYAKISRVNEITQQSSEDSFKSEELAGLAIITAVIFLCFFA